MKGVLTAKIGSDYSDMIEERYHFPNQRRYLEPMEKIIGDEVLFYESRRNGGRSSYIGIGRADKIIEDTESTAHRYVTISKFQNFIEPIRFDFQGGLESSLFKEDGSVNSFGFRKAIRLIPTDEFARICDEGFKDNDGWPERIDQEPSPFPGGFEDAPQVDYERPTVQVTMNMKKRKEWFKHAIRKAYDRRCAFTGLRLINGKGRPEVEAAHIKPVSENGPDSIRNGIALSGTVHWMFDRGMLTLTNEFEIVKSRQLNHDVTNLLVNDMRALVPMDKRLQPHPDYLTWHRENVFKH